MVENELIEICLFVQCSNTVLSKIGVEHECSKVAKLFQCYFYLFFEFLNFIYFSEGVSPAQNSPGHGRL